MQAGSHGGVGPTQHLSKHPGEWFNEPLPLLQPVSLQRFEYSCPIVLWENRGASLYICGQHGHGWERPLWEHGGCNSRSAVWPYSVKLSPVSPLPLSLAFLVTFFFFFIQLLCSSSFCFPFNIFTFYHQKSSSVWKDEAEALFPIPPT